MEIITGVITAVAAYLLGSIPSGYLAGRAKGIDIRSVGSGNIGATNAFRVLGRTVGILVLVADGLKGWVAVALLPGFIAGLVSHMTWNETNLEYLRLTAGMCAILGHNFTIWLHFKGGKGIATSAGVLAALMPWNFIVALAVWIIVCLLTRYVSVASIAAALSLPVTSWFAYRDKPLIFAIATLMGALAIYKHKANIQRLMQGTENRLGAKKNVVPPPQGERL